MKLVQGYTEYTVTVPGQVDVKSATLVARRLAERDGYTVLGIGSQLPQRGSTPHSWVITLKVEKT